MADSGREKANATYSDVRFRPEADQGLRVATSLRSPAHPE
jgi:hypothetical protein